MWPHCSFSRAFGHVSRLRSFLCPLTQASAKRLSYAATVDDAVEADYEEEELKLPRATTSAEANLALLVAHCRPGTVLAEAVAQRAGRLYLGLDVNTLSTGYTVLRAEGRSFGGCDGDNGNSSRGGRNSSIGDDLRAYDERAVRATLVEWGRICPAGARDVVDIGSAIAAELCRIGERHTPARHRPGVLPPVNGGSTHDDVAAAANPATDGATDAEKEERPTAWVVGVEDFMKTFMPGRFNTRALFKMAQLNGIVGYGVLTALGAKATNVHPTSARAFYGLRKNKEEDDVKRVVFDYVVGLEPLAGGGGGAATDPATLLRAAASAAAGTAAAASTAAATVEADMTAEVGGPALPRDWERSTDGSLRAESFDVTDAYLIALYVWHRDLLDTLLMHRALRASFAQAYQEEHALRLSKAELRAVQRGAEQLAVAAAAGATAAPSGGAVELTDDGGAAPAPALRRRRRATAATAATSPPALDEAVLRRRHRADVRKRISGLYEDAVVRWFKAVAVAPAAAAAAYD
ncbi:unnamed protein product [Phaeothamnion confervicola]